MDDQGIRPFISALQSACEELEDQNRNLDDLRTQVSESERTVARLRRLVDELLLNVPEQHWPSGVLDRLGYNRQVQLQLDIGSPAYAEMLKIVFSVADRIWTPAEVAREMSHKGRHVEHKYVSNTLSRLVAKGAIRKVGRGTYKVEGAREVVLGDGVLVIKRREE